MRQHPSPVNVMLPGGKLNNTTLLRILLTLIAIFTCKSFYPTHHFHQPSHLCLLSRHLFFEVSTNLSISSIFMLGYVCRLNVVGAQSCCQLWRSFPTIRLSSSIRPAESDFNPQHLPPPTVSPLLSFKASMIQSVQCYHYIIRLHTWLRLSL